MQQQFPKKSFLWKSLALGCIILLSFSACIKNITKVQLVYQNDFEAYDLKGFYVSGWNNGNFGPISDIMITDYNGSKVLGKFNNHLVSLKISALPEHVAINVQFDLYIHNHWKNDLWKMTFDNHDQLLTGFSNDSLIQQAYPNWLGNGSALSHAGANAYQLKLPGVCNTVNTAYGTSLYKMEKTMAHSDSTFLINLSDAGNPVNDFCGRSWSIDNIKISTIKD